MTTEPEERPIAVLERLYSSLSAADCDELLQELLAARAHGGEAMAVVIDIWLLDRAVRQLISDPVVAPDSDADRTGSE